MFGGGTIRFSVVTIDRWFDESMLDCCVPIDVIEVKGITLPQLDCLARCNGAMVHM